MRAAIAASFSLYLAKIIRMLPFDFSGFLLMGKFSYSCLLGKVLKIAFNLEKKKKSKRKAKKRHEIFIFNVFICIPLMQRPWEKIKISSLCLRNTKITRYLALLNL